MRSSLRQLDTSGPSLGLPSASWRGVRRCAARRSTGRRQPGVDRHHPGGVPVGAFLTATVAFLIVAAVVYFFVVTPYEAAVRSTEVDDARTRRLSCSPSLVLLARSAPRQL